MHLGESKSHLVLFPAGAIVLHFLFYRYNSDIAKKTSEIDKFKEMIIIEANLAFANGLWNHQLRGYVNIT